MPVWTAFGLKSSSSVAPRLGARTSFDAPQPPSAIEAPSTTNSSRRLDMQPEHMDPGLADPRLGLMRRRVTFSRNLTLSLSRTCRCYCKYCAFATHRPHLHEPEEVERLIDGAARRGVKELLVLTGEAPAVQERLAALGFADFVAYVVWACER